MAIKFNNSISTLENELKWLSEMINYRVGTYFRQTGDFEYPNVPDLAEDESYYACMIKENKLGRDERLLILIALTPHVRPAILDIFFSKNERFDRVYAEFGGIKGEKHGGFIPTAETAAFVIAGEDLEKRYQLQPCFDEDHVLSKQNILSLGVTNNHESMWSGELIVSKEFLTNVTLNQPYEPRFSLAFPAQKLTSRLDWEDAVFSPSLLHGINQIRAWVSHEKSILEEMQLDKYLKRGYRALFYGPPGTGKSMTAAILGKSEGMDVYRVDLSSVVSKYIGETEKNLANLFNMAENKRWILFFDEADALFGKRLSTQSSNDMFANQQVAYLLQRVEDFNGVAILASNFKENIDDAFLRRFQSVIYFPKPDQSLRYELWQKYFSQFDISSVDLEKISEDYEITGGSIINVLRYCAIAVAKRSGKVVMEQDIITGIKKELLKEGVTL